MIQGLSQRLVSEDLKGRVMTQAIGIVGVLVPSDDLVEALAKETRGW